jgi:hypothetical protein
MKTPIRTIAAALVLTVFTASIKASAEPAPQLNLNAPRSLVLADQKSNYDALNDAAMNRTSTKVLIGVVAAIGVGAVVGGCYLIHQSFSKGFSLGSSPSWP